MAETLNLNSIFEKIDEWGIFRSVKRFQYLPYDLNLALKVVEAKGKKRNPKFVIDEENRFAYENLIRWVHGDPEFKCLNADTKEVIKGRLDAGIYIAGNTGSGKSWALEIMAAYSIIDNIQIVLGKTQRFLHWENIRTDVICDEYVINGTFEGFKKMNIIGFQDLGSEPIESLYMGNRINVMRRILEYRGDQSDQITLITSNLPYNSKKFVELYGDRVASRLNEMCNYFEITGKDRRKL